MMTIEEAKKSLFDLQAKTSAYEHAMAILYYDAVTVAPKGTADNRAHTTGILSEELYKLTTDERSIKLLDFLEDNKADLNDKELRMVFLMRKSLDSMKKIPMNEYIEYKKLIIEAEDTWHSAKENNDFAAFEPYLEKIYATTKRFAGYLNPSMDPYDYWLNEFEEGASKKSCDRFFNALRNEIVPLLNKIKSAKQVDDSFLKGHFSKAKQEELSYYVMNTMNIDLNHCTLGTTEHPFTEMLGSHKDVRITTHYHEDDVAASLYSVIHEGGHALYDMHSDDEYAYTVLDGGVSMGIHESQSRFYENLLGRSLKFVEHIYPKLVELFPENFKNHTAYEIYKAINKVEPSLIRTEADEVTYCLHVMIRYELEKAIMEGTLKVHDLPKEWNRLYKEYLGIDVPNDTKGVLQDSHWAGGAIGYFPSYALGSAYGAHLLTKLKKAVDTDACLKNGDFTQINKWNCEHIWKYGKLLTPNALLENALNESFDAKHYIEYLTKKYSEIYDLIAKVN